MQRDLLEKQLREYNVELVRAIYVGPDGIARGKAFLPGSIDDVLAHGLGLTQAQASVTVFDHLPPESQFQPVGVAAAAVILFGTLPSLREWIGGLLIIAGCLMLVGFHAWSNNARRDQRYRS